MIVLFAGVFFGGTGVWPWFTAGEPMASIVFFSSVCAFGLGVFFYETYRHYNSFVGYLKDLPEEDGDAEVSTH